jgi:hypothetical protein
MTWLCCCRAPGATTAQQHHYQPTPEASHGPRERRRDSCYCQHMAGSGTQSVLVHDCTEWELYRLYFDTEVSWVFRYDRHSTGPPRKPLRKANSYKLHYRHDYATIPTRSRSSLATRETKRAECYMKFSSSFGARSAPNRQAATYHSV